MTLSGLAGVIAAGSDWLILLAPLVVVGALVALALYVRGGPATSYGYAINARPRRRRVAPQWLLTVLRPLLVYNHHRDAYVLRGIGNRIGPVLRSPHRQSRRSPEPVPEPRRTGRFQRIDPELVEAPAERPPGERGPTDVRAVPRAPVGARHNPHAADPAGEGHAAPALAPDRPRPENPERERPKPERSGGPPRQEPNPPRGKRSKKSNPQKQAPQGGGQQGQKGKPRGPDGRGNKKSKAGRRGG